MNPYFIRLLPVNRWLVGKGVALALLALLAYDGGLSVDPAFALSGVTVTPSPVSFSGTVDPGHSPSRLPLQISEPRRSVSHGPITFLGLKPAIPPGRWRPANHAHSTSRPEFPVLPPESYNGTATVKAAGITKQVTVSLVLSAAPRPPAIGLNTTSLGFSGMVGGANPAAQTVAVSNTGGGTLSWKASDNAAWLILSPVSGTNNGTMTAGVNLTGLTAGTHNTAITVTASGAATKTIPVTLTLTIPPKPPAIGLNPTSLTFTGVAGRTNPAGKPVSISNSGGGTLSWTASESAAWLTLSAVSGTNGGTVSANVNLKGLTAGTYNAAVTVAAPGASAKTLPVTLTLTAPPANMATLTWHAGTEQDLAGYKVYRGTASGTYGAPLATLPKTITSHTATGLQIGTTYFFVITAYDGAGNESTYSNEVSKSIF